VIHSLATRQLGAPVNQPPVRMGIIGAGAVSELQHHPGIRVDPRAELVAICDPNETLLAERRQKWGVDQVYTEYHRLIERDDIDAVIIATPNFTHVDIAMAALAAGKHVMCEKPLGVSAEQVRPLCQAARDSGRVNMTAFTYRFAPSMRYLRHLVHSGALGEPRHFRSQRFLDWPETSWGWRQYRETAGAGDLYDMTVHRIDFAMDLLGPLDQVCGSVAQFVPRTKTVDGQSCPASDVDDWSALIGRFRSGAVGVWEGTTLAKGYDRSGFGHEWAEVNGSEASAVYRLHRPNSIWIGRSGSDLTETPVPQEFLKPVGSPRSIDDPDPAIVFRYDLAWEFCSAICEGRAAEPSFADGWRAQVVADAVLQSSQQGTWVTLASEGRERGEG
jgi:predicted dehydrogenase